MCVLCQSLFNFIRNYFCFHEQLLEVRTQIASSLRKLSMKYFYFFTFIIQQLILLSIHKLSMFLFYLLLPFLLALLYVIYMFLIKIYIDAARFKKMDPNLKLFVAPFSGLQGVQQRNLQQYGDTHYFTKQIMRENPEINAYFTNIGYRPVLMLCSTALIKHFCLNHKQFTKFNVFKHSYKSYTKGIFFVSGEDWSTSKSIIRNSFNYDSLKRMIPIMVDGMDNYIKMIKSDIQSKKQKGQDPSFEYDVIHDNEKMVGSILVRIFFSQSGKDKIVFGKNLSVALAEFTIQMFNRSRTAQNIIFELFMGPAVTKVNFTKQDKKLELFIDEIRKIVNEIIDVRFAMKDEDQQKDLIFDYIKAIRERDAQIKALEKEGKSHKLKPVTREELVQQLISFYFAGIDTTGHLIAMALYSIAEYPEVRTKLEKQIRSLVKSKQDLTYENLQKFQYMGKVLDECLRMWPPTVGVLLRVAKHDMQIGPYSVREGTLVGTNLIGVLNNPKFYDHPEIFNPDRWNDKTKYNEEPYAYIPFSAGGRSCIGKYVALMESKLAVIEFMNQFQIERTEVPLRMSAKFLYEPDNSMLVRLKEGGLQIY